MADLVKETVVRGDTDTGLHVEISDSWRLLEINGGYLATIALRAAAKASSKPRPVSLSCHFLNPAKPGQADIAVHRLKIGFTADAIQVDMNQGGTPVLTAMVWFAPGGAAFRSQQQAPRHRVANSAIAKLHRRHRERIGHEDATYRGDRQYH